MAVCMVRTGLDPVNDQTGGKLTSPPHISQEHHPEGRPMAAASVYDFDAVSIDGKPAQLSSQRGKVLLIVNTASACGFTPQFAGLEKLWEKYKDRGLVIVGFPSNEFGGQDPGSNDEIASFCQLNYGVSFPMMGKVKVN